MKHLILFEDHDEEHHSNFTETLLCVKSTTPDFIVGKFYNLNPFTNKVFGNYRKFQEHWDKQKQKSMYSYFEIEYESQYKEIIILTKDNSLDEYNRRKIAHRFDL